MIEVFAVFDIGKTNKKFVVFDSDYSVIFQIERYIPTISDGEGHYCENISVLVQWVLDTLQSFCANKLYRVKGINFSTYGATLVHLDENGELVFPVYEYNKPFEQGLINDFISKYSEDTCLDTATPLEGMLNSGLQLYWLKTKKKSKFNKTKYALHFPQYFSYLFTKVPSTEICSIGCHTLLWDFQKGNYHSWVQQEGFDLLFPPIRSLDTMFDSTDPNLSFRIGIGIHDSSAAIIPYLKVFDQPFILLSTGTWFVAMNAFIDQDYDVEDLIHKNVNYMRFDGKAIRSAKAFLGHDFEILLNKICKIYDIDQKIILETSFNSSLLDNCISEERNYFQFESIKRKTPLIALPNEWTVEQTYHQLIFELAKLVIEVINAADGSRGVINIIIDGGFSKNKLFIDILKYVLPQKDFYLPNIAYGSALGAMLVCQPKIDRKALIKTLGILKL